MKRTRLRRVSKRARARNEVRSLLLDQWMQALIDAPTNFTGVPLCEVAWDRGCTGVATDGHEKLTRRRGSTDGILDRENVVMTCRYCHDQIHAYPVEAIRRGFLLPSRT